MKRNKATSVSFYSVLFNHHSMNKEGKGLARKHGAWTIHATHRRYKDQLIELNEDEVTKPDGTQGTYTTIKIKEGVKVLALDDDNFAYFAREFRYALGSETLEAGGGALDEHETPQEAARRELREEMGIEAEELIELGQLHHTPSLIHSTSTLFLARGLRFTKKNEDSGEIIKTVKLPFDQAKEMALDGQLTHASTCVLILRANNYLRKADKAAPQT